MDERRQYTPTATRTYPADNDTIGIEPESIVREAINKITDYKNVEAIPVDTSEAMTLSHIKMRKYTRIINSKKCL